MSFNICLAIEGSETIKKDCKQEEEMFKQKPAILGTPNQTYLIADKITVNRP